MASLWRFGFVCVFIVAAILRLRGLTFQSYWDDELFSVGVSAPHNSLWQVIRLTLADVHPPLFQLLLWGWFKILGFSEWSGRLLPAVLGLLALPVLYRLGCEVRSRAVGFSMALLCAVNIFHLYYSQEVRSYSLLFLLGAWSLLRFVRLLDAPDRKNLAAWVLVSIAMIYTHFFGVLALAAECFALLLLLRGRPALRRPAIAAAIAFGVAVVPMVPQVIRGASMGTFWIRQEAADFAVSYFLQYFGSPVIAVAAALAMCYGILRSGADKRSIAILPLLLLWLAAVLLLPYIRGLFSTPMLTARNTIIALPVIFLLAALGIDAIRQPVLRGLLLAGLSALSMLHILHYSRYYEAPTKPQIRQAAQALMAAHPEAGAVYAPIEVVENFNLYFALYAAPFRVRPLAELPALDGSVPLPPRIWLVDGRAGPALAVPIMRDPRLRLIERRNFRNAAVAVLEPLH